MFDQILHPQFHFSLEASLLLLILVALEAVLSADNAVALAAIAQGLKSPEQQRTALNIGLVAAYVLRITLIFTATWFIHFWQVSLFGALYLLWLTFSYFTSGDDEDDKRNLEFASLWQAVPMIHHTDVCRVAKLSCHDKPLQALRRVVWSCLLLEMAQTKCEFQYAENKHVLSCSALRDYWLSFMQPSLFCLGPSYLADSQVCLSS